MNITFLIGNGFDLRLGMHTSYSDVYGTYMNKSSSSDCIASLKEELKRDEPKGYRTWGDFEMAMGKHSKTFESEDSFVECVRDFKLHMAEHLQNEQNKYFARIDKLQGYRYSVFAEEMVNSLSGFYEGQDRNTIELIDGIHSIFKGKNYRFVTFNYTTVLDNIVDMTRQYYKKDIWQTPIHVHGKLDGDIVLGVNDIEQVLHEEFRESRRLQRAFVKPLYNKMFDNSRVNAALDAIENSHVICVYGLSLGDSDLFWRKAIIQWLKANESHHLVYYMYDTRKFNSWLRDAIMDEEEDRKFKLLRKLTDSVHEQTALFNQVHIPVGYDIFDFQAKIAANKNEKSSEYMTATSRPINKT